MAEKKKRTTLTPAERIARAEAELAAVRKKEAAKAKAKIEKKREELKLAGAALIKAEARVAKIQDELEALEDLVQEEGYGAMSLTEEQRSNIRQAAASLDLSGALVPVTSEAEED